MLTISFDSAFEKNTENNITQASPLSASATQDTPVPSSAPSSSLVFAGISYWTLLMVLMAIAVGLLVLKFILKRHFYHKNT